MLLRVSFVLTLLIALIGCGPDALRPAEPAPGAEIPAQTADRPPLPELLASADQQYEDGALVVLGRLGVPRSVEAEPVENRHVEGQIDTLKTYDFRGLELEVYATAPGRQLLQEVRVTGEGFATVEGLHIGSTRADVRRALGEPTEARDDALVYEQPSGPDDPTPTTLTLRFGRDRVTEMAWSYYVD